MFLSGSTHPISCCCCQSSGRHSLQHKTGESLSELCFDAPRRAFASVLLPSSAAALVGIYCNFPRVHVNPHPSGMPPARPPGTPRAAERPSTAARSPSSTPRGDPAPRCRVKRTQTAPSGRRRANRAGHSGDGALVETNDACSAGGGAAPHAAVTLSDAPMGE